MMDFCHQMNMYSLQVGTLLGIIFTMIAFSRIAKKQRDETAYTALVGVSLMSLVNLFLYKPLGHVIDLAPSSYLVTPLWSAVVSALVITALLTAVGKALKVKAMPPKTIALCFFVGIAAANFVLAGVDKHCSAPAKSSKAVKNNS